MSFLRENDHIIVMNSNENSHAYNLKYYSLSDDELKRLHEYCGVNIGHEQALWSQIEPRPGVYDWSQSDRLVDRVLRAGMRCLLCLPMDVPNTFPKEWYWKGRSGNIIYDGFSFWHEEAQAYLKDFCRQMIERYSSDDVQLIYHGYLGGESVLHNSPCFFDDAALNDYRTNFGTDPEVSTVSNFELGSLTKQWLRERVIWHHLYIQDLFVKQCNEVWDELQPNIAKQSWANGNFAQYDIHRAYSGTWPDVEQWIIFYTYFIHTPEIVAEMEEIANDFRCRVVCEANYCEGFRDQPTTYKIAIEKNFRAQIVGPLSPWREHKQMEPWMYTAIKEANDEWLHLR